mmetsp:Transcript_10149/g.26002  ORF Transcript_10149/g.26002 Transcript_10149/m.26002 type:complete len:169 (-) Transcript_10149:305-811(-)|eukprot:jgi/Tetstr1/458388/TSEL_044826.t1
MAKREFFASQGDLRLKTACGCCSQAFWFKSPDCLSCANEMVCCCMSGSMSCGLTTSPPVCYSSAGETSCVPMSVLSCSGPVCTSTGSGIMCCFFESTSAFDCGFKCKACLECKSQMLCMDSRAALPPSQDSPCEIGLCGVMCYKNNQVGVAVEPNLPTNAPGGQKMTR